MTPATKYGMSRIMGSRAMAKRCCDEVCISKRSSSIERIGLCFRFGFGPRLKEIAIELVYSDGAKESKFCLSFYLALGHG